MSETSLENGKSLLRKRFAHLSSAITNRLWLNAHSNYECDVLLTFPEKIDDQTIIWFLEEFLRLEPDIRIMIKYHFTTGKKKKSETNSVDEICIVSFCHRCLRILFDL